MHLVKVIMPQKYKSTKLSLFLKLQNWLLKINYPMINIFALVNTTDTCTKVAKLWTHTLSKLMNSQMMANGIIWCDLQLHTTCKTATYIHGQPHQPVLWWFIASCLLIWGRWSHLKTSLVLMDIWQAIETSHSKSELSPPPPV